MTGAEDRLSKAGEAAQLGCNTKEQIGRLVASMSDEERALFYRASAMLISRRRRAASSSRAR